MKKDYYASTVLSIVAPGTGQFYNGQIGKGIGVMLLSFTLIPWLWGIFDARYTSQRMNDGTLAHRPCSFSWIGAYLCLPALSALAVIGLGGALSTSALSAFVQGMGPMFYSITAAFLVGLTLFVVQAFSLNRNISFLKPIMGAGGALVFLGIAAFGLGVLESFSAVASVDPAAKAMLLAQGIAVSLSSTIYASILAATLGLWTVHLYVVRLLVHRQLGGGAWESTYP